MNFPKWCTYFREASVLPASTQRFMLVLVRCSLPHTNSACSHRYNSEQTHHSRTCFLIVPQINPTAHHQPAHLQTNCHHVSYTRETVRSEPLSPSWSIWASRISFLSWNDDLRRQMGRNGNGTWQNSERRCHDMRMRMSHRPPCIPTKH